MNENYCEYAVEVRDRTKAFVKLLASAVLAVSGLYLAMSVHFLCILLVIAGAAGGYFFYQQLQTEYETIFLDGNVEISAVYRKMRRKKKYQFDMKDVTGYFLGRKENAVRLGRIEKDFSSGEKDALCCVMKISRAEGTEVVCLEPGEELASILKLRYRQLEVS